MVCSFVVLVLAWMRKCVCERETREANAMPEKGVKVESRFGGKKGFRLQEDEWPSPEGKLSFEESRISIHPGSPSRGISVCLVELYCT